MADENQKDESLNQVGESHTPGTVSPFDKLRTVVLASRSGRLVARREPFDFPQDNLRRTPELRVESPL